MYGENTLSNPKTSCKLKTGRYGGNGRWTASCCNSWEKDEIILKDYDRVLSALCHRHQRQLCVCVQTSGANA